MEDEKSVDEMSWDGRTIGDIAVAEMNDGEADPGPAAMLHSTEDPSHRLAHPRTRLDSLQALARVRQPVHLLRHIQIRQVPQSREMNHYRLGLGLGSG